jgi:hypothetical protein
MLKYYNKCIYCGSKKLAKEKKQYFLDNFYLKAIRSDLNISVKYLKNLKTYKCNFCGIIQSNPWFSEQISRKIYSNIYGQHNRSWTNLINFFKKGILPDHGNLFSFLLNKINIKSYGEFNSPFMGLFLNFFNEACEGDKSSLKKHLENHLKYLSYRQVAGFPKKTIKSREIKVKKLHNKIINFKKQKLSKNKIHKSLIVDNSGLSWGQNDNYKSVNSKTLASELFDLDLIDINRIDKNKKFDLFGIFHTLDHTFEPKKIFDYAIKKSRYVIVYCHVDKRLEKQHLFTFTESFLKYLSKNNVYTINLTDKINKNFKVSEMYFLCSKQKKNIKIFDLNIVNEKL